MQKTIPTIFLVFAVLFATAGTSWSQEVDYLDLVQRDGLYYRPFTDVPFTGEVTGWRQGSIKDGKRIGLWVSYYSKGQLWDKGNYINGERDGPWISYWDNGQLFYKGNYVNGERHGPWVGYYDNGQLSYKGSHINGMHDGPWIFYNEYGGLLEISGTYKEGERVSD